MQSLVNSHVYSKLAQCCQGEISTVLHSIVRPFANKTANKYILLLLPKECLITLLMKFTSFNCGYYQDLEK